MFRILLILVSFGLLGCVTMPATLVQEREKKVLIQEEEKEAAYSDGIKVNLTKQDIQEAIDLGVKYKDTYDENVRSLYQFGDRKYGKESGSIQTKFSLVAYVAYSAAKEYRNLERDKIEGGLPLLTDFTISIYTYGDKIDFAKDYHMVIKQGEKVIQPVNVKTDKWGRATLAWPYSPKYSAFTQARFLYSEIDPHAKTTIILIKDLGESRFEVDFSRYK